MRWLVFFSLSAVSALRVPLTSDLGPVVDLGYAAFAGNTTSPTGVENGTVTFFGGIPYAQPPLGNLRWRAPRMLNENTIATEVVDARDWGPMCLQYPAQVGIGSEDCLMLNVWKPTNAKAGDKLPVAAYIHGGGFYAGSPQGFSLYNWVAQHPGGIVGVSIAYRLGLPGFLAGSRVQADGDLNVGLLDQRAGLEWIQRHIAMFGGDPDNVSIYGESAGGASVVMQVTAYGGKKGVPFKGAVAQSIGLGTIPTDAQKEAIFQNVTKFVGCPSNSSETMSCLRKASLGAIVSAINRSPRYSFTPGTDGPDGIVPDRPSLLIHSGSFTDVNFIGGHCTNDGRTFVGGTPEQFVTDDDIIRIVSGSRPGVSSETINEALALYPAPGTPGSPYATQYDRAAAIAGDIVYTCMDWLLANKTASKGVKNVFAFRWNSPDTVLYNATPYLGTMHTSDIYFLFDGENSVLNGGYTFAPFNQSEVLLAKEAIAYWTSFAAAGDPSSLRLPSSPMWDFYDANETTRQRMVLTRGPDGSSMTSSRMETLTSDEIKRCTFWMSANVTAQTML